MGGRELVGISLILIGALTPARGRAQAEEAPVAEEDPDGEEDATSDDDDTESPPTTDEDRRARELYELGDRLYAHGQYDAAIDSFREAYRLSHRPLMLFNLANAQERAGYLHDAVESLERYLPDAPEAESVALANRIAALRERMESEGDPDQSPDPNPNPDPDPHPYPNANPNPHPNPSPNPDPHPHPNAHPYPNASPAPDLVGPAVLLGAGGVLLATGLVLGIVSLDLASRIDSMCASLDDGRRLCPIEAESMIDANLTTSAITDVSLVFGAVGAALGVYLLVDAISGQDASVEVRAAIGPGSVALVGRFP